MKIGVQAFLEAERLVARKICDDEFERQFVSDGNDVVCSEGRPHRARTGFGQTETKRRAAVRQRARLVQLPIDEPGEPMRRLTFAGAEPRKNNRDAATNRLMARKTAALAGKN